MASKNFIRRYTNLSSLLDVLHNSRLTLLSPNSWDDLNDQQTIELYKQQTGARSVVGLCFTGAVETYHHWRVFSNTAHGICIRFHRNELQKGLQKAENKAADFEFRRMNYQKLEEVQNNELETCDLPFTKRYAYNGEDEWRLLHSSNTPDIACKHLKLDLSLIAQIDLSPWMPDALVAPCKKTLRQISGCADIEIRKSKIIDSVSWKMAIR